jgi:hypothetical protein
MNQPLKASWWNRNWKWLVPIGCLSSIIMLVGFVAVIITLVFGVMKSSDVYTQGLSRAQASPAVMQALGSPIQAGFFLSGTINVSGPSGNAEIAIPISGPKGRGTIYLVARRSAGEWSFSQLEVALETSNTRINLLTTSGAMLNRSLTRNLRVKLQNGWRDQDRDGVLHRRADYLHRVDHTLRQHTAVRAGQHVVARDVVAARLLLSL